MAETGLQFTSDGSSNYIKTLNQILTVSDRLDAAILKIVKDSRKWHKIQLELNKSITSSTRRMNTLIDRVTELDIAFAEVISRVPKLVKELQRGFEGGKLDKFMQNKGAELGEAFMRGIETELGIASPSKKMRYVAGEIERGFNIGLKAGRWAASGAKVAGQWVGGFVKNVSKGIRDGMGAVVRIVRTGIQQIEAELDKAGRALRDSGGSMVNAGLTGIATGGIIAGATIGAAGLAVNEAVQFEQIMTNTGAILGQNREEMAGLNAELLRVGGQSLAGVDATATAFYDIVSGVQDASLHMDILNAAIATSEAGQADLTATTSGLVAMMNSYSASGIGAEQVSDVFSRTVQMGVGSMNQFVAAMSPIAGLAASVGVSVDELGAGMAFLTAKGATTSAAATRLQSAMVSLLKPNTQMAAALEAAGYESGQAAIEALGLAGALDVVNTALDGDSAAFAAALGSTEALQGAVGLLSEDYADFYDTYNEGLDGATDRSRALQLEGTYAIFARIQSAVGALSVEIGSELLPMVRVLAEGFLFVVDSVLNFMRENRALVGTLIRIATITGVLIGGIIALGGAMVLVSGLFVSAVGFVLTFTAALIGLTSAYFGFAKGLLAVANHFAIFEGGLFSMEGAMQRVLRVINNVKAGLRAVTGGDIQTASADPATLERENKLLAERESLLNDISNANEGITESQEHQVEAGDTLWDLAQRYGTTVEAIREANDIEGSMIGIGQELVIPVSADTSNAEEELALMEAELARIDSELGGLGSPVPVGLETMNTDMQALVSSADLVVDGFMSIFSGDVTGGLETVRSGFVGIGDAVGNLWGRFQTGFAANDEAMANPFGESFADQIQIDGGGTNPITDWMNTVVSEAGNMDFSTLSQTIADNLDSIVSGAMAIVGAIIGFPIGSTIGFARMLVWAVENDFMGIGTLLTESGALGFFETAWDGLVGDFDAFVETTGIDLHLDSLIGDAVATDLAGSTVSGALGFFETAWDGLVGDFDAFVETTGIDLHLDSLIGDAVATDLAGFTVDLSVIDPVLESFAILKTGLMDGMANLFVGLFGEGESPLDAQLEENMDFRVSTSPFEQAIAGIQPLLQLIMGMGATAIDNLPIIAQGLVDFFGALFAGIDMEIMGNLFTEVGMFIGAIVSIGTILGSGVLGGLSEAGADIGLFVAELINAGAALLSGDLGGAFHSLVGALGALLSGIANFSIGAADGVILALNNLFDIDLPSVDEGLVAYAGAFENAWLALSIIIDNIKRDLSLFANSMREDILELLAGLRDDIFAGSLETIDIAPNINMELEAVAGANVNQLNQDAIAQTLNEQIGEDGAIDLTVPIEINGEVTTLGMLTESVDAQNFGTANTQALINALGFAYESGDMETVRALMPLALDVGIDVEGIVGVDDVANDIAVALEEGDIGTATELLDFASDVGVNVEDVIVTLGEMGVDDASIYDLVTWGLTGALAEGDAELATDLVRISTALEIDISEILTTFEGSAGYEEIRDAVVQSMAEDAGEGDEAALALQVPIALVMGVTEDEVLEAGNEAGFAIGEEIELGLNTSLQIESPSLVGVQAGMFLMEGIAMGMLQMVVLIAPILNMVNALIMDMVKQYAVAEQQMNRISDNLSVGFQAVADSAKGLWSYLNAIKLMMVDLGMTAGEANAAVAGGAGNTGENILAAAGWESAGGTSPPQGRAHGGDVLKGNVYETNEGGITEMALIGGRTYLLAGEDGYVSPITPVSDVLGAGAIGGGGGSATNTINYNGDFVMQIPPEAEDPEVFQDLFVEAMEEYNSQTTISDRFRDKI